MPGRKLNFIRNRRGSRSQIIPINLVQNYINDSKLNEENQNEF